MPNYNKQRLRGIQRKKDKYNSMVDGKYKPSAKAKEEMNRKPYGMGNDK